MTARGRLTKRAGPFSRVLIFKSRGAILEGALARFKRTDAYAEPAATNRDEVATVTHLPASFQTHGALCPPRSRLD